MTARPVINVPVFLKMLWKSFLNHDLHPEHSFSTRLNYVEQTLSTVLSKNEVCTGNI